MSEQPSFWSNCRLEIIACVIWLWKQGWCRKLWRKIRDHHIDQNNASVKNKKKRQSQREPADCPAIKSSVEIQRKLSSKANLNAKFQTWLRSSSFFVAPEQDLSPRSEWASECSLAQLNEAVAQSGHRWGISQVTTKPLDNILEWLCWAGWVPAQWEKGEEEKTLCNYTAILLYLLLLSFCLFQH